MLGNRCMIVSSCRVSGFGISNLDEMPGILNQQGYLFNPNRYPIGGLAELLRDSDEGVDFQYDPPSISDLVHFDGISLCIVAPTMVMHNVSIIDDSPDMVIFQSSSCYQTSMDTRDGHKISCSGFYLFKRAYDEYNNPSKCDAERLAEEFEMNEQAYQLGFREANDAIANIAPYVPDSIRQICRYFDLFETPKTIFELRPMHLVYRRSHD